MRRTMRHRMCSGGQPMNTKLRRYAEQAGYTIVGVAAEHGSGLTLDRPALQELTEAVLAGKVDVVRTPLCKITLTGEIEQRFRLN